MWLGRFYWQTVKRWPVLHALGCSLGILCGVACFFVFWSPGPNERQDRVLKALGVLMMVGYGWILAGCLWKLMRGTWPNHCDRQRLIFSADRQPSGNLKPRRSIAFRPSEGQILVASLVVLAAMAEVLFGVQHHWHDLFTTMVFSTGLFYGPLLAYVAVRRMIETGFSWLWLLSACAGIAATVLGALAIHFLITRYSI